MKLFAMDLDGTLLDREDGIHPRDAEAIARARAQGVIVTIATGRLTSRTHPTARSLSLTAPLICADGAVLSCGETERVLAQYPLSPAVSAEALELFGVHGLSRFAFTHEAIHCCPLGMRYEPYVRVWSHFITAHEDLRRAPLLEPEAEGAIMLVGIGERAQVERVQAALGDLRDQVELIAFDVGGGSVLRLMAKGTSKGSALSALTRELAIAPEHVGVIGDWFNDLSMFEFAGHAFAMPHAPSEVKAKASHVLDARAPERGAIAEALDCWLAAFA
jgi:Cof subfamily protein (haloacid dehalogenase superfamily)